jgi:hypothetical protein
MIAYLNSIESRSCTFRVWLRFFDYSLEKDQEVVNYIQEDLIKNDLNENEMNKKKTRAIRCL